MITANHRSAALALLVAAFILFGTQLDLLPDLTWHDQQRLAQTTLLAVFVIISGASFRPDVCLNRNAVFALASIATLGAVSAAASRLPAWAWIEWSLLVSLFVATLLVGMLRREAGASFDQAFTWLVFAVCAMFALRFLATYAAGMAADADLDTRELSSLGFSNRRFFGQMQTLTLPLLAIPVLLAHTRTLRNVAFLLLATWWMLAFVSATRGTLLAMALAIPLAGLRSGASGKQWLRWQAAGLVAGIALYALLMLILPDLLGVEIAVESRWGRLFDSSGRLGSWMHTVDLIRSRPALGVGPMHLAYWLSPTVPVAHPHNAMLQVAAEWGIPAAILSGGVVVHCLLRFASRFHGSRASALSASLLAALVGAGIQSMVDGVMVMPVTQVFVMLFAGWALGMFWSHKPERARSIRVTGSALTLVLACTVSVLAFAALRDFRGLAARQDAYIAKHSAYLHPRYWQQGWIGEPPEGR